MEEMEKQAQHCNDKKSKSKRAQELSNEIFFAAFVKVKFFLLHFLFLEVWILNNLFCDHIVMLSVMDVFCYIPAFMFMLCWKNPLKVFW